MRSQLSKATVRPGCGSVFRVNLFALRTPVIGIGLSAFGPTHPVTWSPVCLNEAMPGMVPPAAEIVTRHVPVTFAAGVGAAEHANNKALRSARRVIMLTSAANKEGPLSLAKGRPPG